jgi:hypothetical protein
MMKEDEGWSIKEEEEEKMMGDGQRSYSHHLHVMAWILVASSSSPI